MSNNGKLGEQLFKEVMEARGYEVQDVSNNSAYWHRDIDFVITSPTTGEVKTFEVKWDTRINRTGNLFLERANAHSDDGRGWYEFCEADYLAYGDAVSGQFYMIPLLDLRIRVKQLAYREAKCGTESIGQLVSLRDIADITTLL